MVFLRILFLITASYCFAQSVLAQNLVSTPISVAPYYFNATPSMPPPTSIPYQAAPYWQQSYEPWQTLTPAFSEFASSLAQALIKDNGDVYYDDKEERRLKKDYKLQSDFLYERESKKSTSQKREFADVKVDEKIVIEKTTSSNQPEQNVDCLNSLSSAIAIDPDKTKDLEKVITKISESTLDESDLGNDTNVKE